MAIPLTEAEAGLIARVKTFTRKALTEGTEGGGVAAINPVITAELFDGSQAASDGTKLNALGLIQAFELDGILLRSTNGNLWRLGVSNSGAAVFTLVATTPAALG